MSKNKVVTRIELLDRWRAIEEEEDDDDDQNEFDNSKQLHFRRLKETWFADAFNFLIYLPREDHIWCGFWDIMGPLLETFYNYFKDDRHDSPLKLLWKRVSEELQVCMQCICQHHQAKDTYAMEYELSSIGPLLDVLCRLDEERVTNQLKEMNTRIAQGDYDQVLMYPVLLDDQSLVTEFQIFIEAVDDSHELNLDGHQQYPGVYALLFLKTRRCRSIGFRLAGYMGKLRNASDLDPLQPLLKKCFAFLETEVVSLNADRPRMQLDRISVWLGIKALLGFLEPSAFEEGILECYPNFLSIVLNHICDDSLEFSYAINCLKLLFQMLGCKLWLRAALSPSVMRDTLLGQCFHTRDEKSHKEIFDLFPPFLQSLEALQDGEYKQQRRRIIYFLLHQVTVSSNFNTLMRKKACQIALLIIHRGYIMNPSCPPFECAHMWGPSLVASLKDSTLYSSLRQPAFDLIQTIIVSDASALVSSILHFQIHKSVDMNIVDSRDKDDNEDIFADDVVEDKDESCWNQFSMQSQITSTEYGAWMCIPMLWVDVLVEIDPAVLPVSFYKAVLWALSRFSMVEPGTSTEMALPVGHWLTTNDPDVSHLFGWRTPSGSDDGGDGEESKNSVKVTTMCIPLIRTFRRLTAHFISRVEQSELRNHWTWEPRMAESLILLIVDPDDNARQVGRRILEQVANTRGLVSCLMFLCSSSVSKSAVLLGLRHAQELLLLDSVLQRFQSLHHFFFVLCKLLTEGLPSGQYDERSKLEVSSQGGFLQQPTFDSMTPDIDGNPSKFDSTHWKKFGCLLSEVAWSSFCICLSEGKAFIDYKISQMTCIRLLECLPVVVQRLQQSMHKIPGDSDIMLKNSVSRYKWLHDLMHWGKSTLVVVVRYWKQTMVSLLDMLKKSSDDITSSSIMAIEKLIQSENILVDALCEQVSCLLCSLKDDAHIPFNGYGKAQTYTVLYNNKSSTAILGGFPSENSIPLISNSDSGDKTVRESVIVLSDDDDNEIDVRDNIDTVCVSHGVSSPSAFVGEEAMGSEDTDERASKVKERVVNITEEDTTTRLVNQKKKVEVERDVDRVRPSSSVPKGKSVQGTSKGKSCDVQKKKSVLMKSRVEKNISSKLDNSVPCQRPPSLKKNISDGFIKSSNQGIKKASEKSDEIVKELVFDAKDDPWESALKSARHHHSHLTKLLKISGPKRKVIQLNLPIETRVPQSNRLRGGHQRFKPVSLDDWFRPILEMDYFSTVGLSSSSSSSSSSAAAAAAEKKNQTAVKLKEVPVCFKSADDYVSVFRPLVLEELKAQLHSSYMEMSSSDEMSCGSLSVMSVERVDDFHVVRCIHDDKELQQGSRTCVENDLILLTRQSFQNSSHDVHMIGKVERCEKDNRRRSSILMIKLYLQNGSSRLNRAKKLLLERSKWYIHRIMSIVSQIREFQALSSIHSIPLLPVILNPENQPKILNPRTDLSKLSKPLQHILESSFNDCQLQAISTVTGMVDLTNNHDLSLIQGPPGTGKTRTIVAIVSALFSKLNARRMESSGVRAASNTCSVTKMKMGQTAAIARAWQDAALAKQQLKDDEVVINSRGDTAAASHHMRGRVLICAQSNAAVDELVSRISSHGLYDIDGIMYKPYLVRVGNAKTVHSNSLRFFIDTLVDQRLKAEEMLLDGNSDVTGGDTDGDSSTVVRSKLEKLVDRIRFLEAKRANLSNGNNFIQGDDDDMAADDVKKMSDAEIGAKLRVLYSDKKAVYIELATAQAREKKLHEKRKALKIKLRKSILREAEIVITTLSGCGGDLYTVCCESMLTHKFSPSSESSLFDAVVIDEAAQALEPATLIPLQLLKSKGSKSIMVGDPKQLPATVLSDVASKYLYQCSMFERLQKAGHPVIMLTKQYRMHPDICRFPSLHFYDGNLLNGDGMCSKDKPYHKTRGLGPYLFFDIVDGQELHGKNSGSLYNECEVDAAVQLLTFFRKSYPLEFVGGRIGIITPYRSQLSLLHSRFSAAFGSCIMDEMELNTVDGFQGREVDILVVSTVRAAAAASSEKNKNNSSRSSSSIGFVSDVRRMNVALTRAKHSLWILGNATTLQANKNWGALVNDAKDRNLVLSVTKPYVSTFNSLLLYKSSNRVPDDSSFNLSEQRNSKKTGNEVNKHHPEKRIRSNNVSCTRKREYHGGRSNGTEDSYIEKKKAKVQFVNNNNNNNYISEDKGKESVDDSLNKKASTDVKLATTEDGLGKKGSGRRHKLDRNVDIGGGSETLSKTIIIQKKEGLGSTSSRSSSSSSGQVEEEPGDPVHRKKQQQREAVDALLPSAFISSSSSKKKKKQPESSSLKSVPDRRRSCPPIRPTGHAIRPTKTRKG
ncbi:uncharacterized protein [Rutidosis leptorrhynchoides]|uniref:uncharacterized protein isoform X2 n=1 Tax=Rutidosis leptorrhynchoides TaxID=125765 RepID=UPI003A98E8DD